ncbi:foldase protein PrsA [Paenibacillus phyllosphaerae]|uniref:Foldase protein PrsA n=1 Tax=Paenibacillus phyllosphaerae TaxID=274593 RepID=A0A7W5B475_9BACL|nr:peptidylprolyl isomerase [Paenibacillus phyllosphaerae]MBB3114109.1 foldase protein PrsA [Paenibacillus phyllosphaerae]
MLRINWKKGTLLALTAVLVLVLAAGCGKKEETNTATESPGAGTGTVIATYKDGDKTAEVTEDEFNKYTAFFSIVNPQTASYLQIPQLKEQFLREYIGYKILTTRLPEQTDEQKKKSEEQTNSFYDQVKTAADSSEDLKKQLDDAKLTESDIKYFYSMITNIMDNEQSKVTDEAVQKQFEASKDDYNVVTLRHILVATSDSSTGEELRTEEEALKRAQEVKKKLDAGGDWTTLAKEYSDDPGSKDNGGLYDAQAVGGYVTEFKDAANTQEIGKIGEPVKTTYGYHVIKVEKREATTFDKLTDDEKTTIKQNLASESLNTFMSTELEGLITKIDLPTDETATEGTTEGTTNGTTEGGTTEEGTTNTGTEDTKTDEGTTNSGTTDSGASTTEETTK